jgi:DNA-binding beta-propeller fold protein YncE
MASAADTDFTFNVCVSDAGNFATPGGAVQSGSVTINELNALAYADGTGTNTVEVFSTSQASTPNAAVASIALTGTPAGVAITPDGKYAIVPQDAPDDVNVIDTITNTPIAGSPFALPVTCSTPMRIMCISPVSAARKSWC